MQLRPQYLSILAASLIICLTGCIGSKLGSRSKGEVPVLVVHQGTPIDTVKLQDQLAFNESGHARGDFFDPTSYGTTAVSMVATGIKNAIDNENKKYSSSYEFNIAPDHRAHKLYNDSMYFYNKSSHQGQFDYRDMKFSGFSVDRFINGDGHKGGHGHKKDTVKKVAMHALFELDTANLCEIAHDGIFRLKLKEFEIHYAKAKIPRGRKKIDLDIQVQFLTSYISKDGQFFTNVVLGTFTKNINGVILQDTASFRKFANQPMDGWSFIVPRSYYHSSRGDMWGQGSYSIKVTVKETSKPRFINQLANDQGGDFIDATTKGIIVENLMAPKAAAGGSKSKAKSSSSDD